MFSRARKPSSSLSSSTISSNTTFSSDNFYIRTRSTPRPVILRHLNVCDLDGINSTDFIYQRQMQREPFRIPRPILTIPRPTIHLPTDDSFWAPTSRPIRAHQSSSSSSPFSISRYSQRPIYQNLLLEPLHTHLPSPQPPPPLPPPIPIQYQTGPPPFQRYTRIPIVHPIKQKKYSCERPPGLFTTLCAGGLNTVAAFIYLCFLLALPITKLVLGILYVNECPVNKNIPLYMIISGACGLAIVVLIFFTSACTYCRSMLNARKQTHGFIIFIIAFTRAVRGALAIFLFIWFLFGNIWVFNARYRVRTDKPNDTNNYCHATLYWFAFYVLIFTYVYAICTCFLKFCVNFFCCGICDGFYKAFS
ncbi:unnamed protein product [Rotaria socialis]|uniref:Uncharacterized protein n=1 Tax=Rotaria socialis TaxID=392032 RepID=A0A818Q0J7_9BILA|nr:unnamed protein product [Rotaria socialis]